MAENVIIYLIAQFKYVQFIVCLFRPNKKSMPYILYQFPPEKCFSNFNMHMNPLRIILKYRFWSTLRGKLRFCISKKHTGGAIAAPLWVTLRMAGAVIHQL